MPDASGRLGVAVLGSTGSIGTQTLDVVRQNPDRYRVAALATGRNADLLAAQAAEFSVPADRGPASRPTTPAALAALAALDEVDVVINGVVGFAGLPARSPPSRRASASAWPTRRASSRPAPS